MAIVYMSLFFHTVGMCDMGLFGSELFPLQRLSELDFCIEVRYTNQSSDILLHNMQQ